MEVTHSNFKSILPEIEQDINNCTYLSIDCELTGLKTALNCIKAFDTPAEYYEKVIKDCREFLVIQYGITFFRYDQASDIIKHKSYNFYIFRKPLNKSMKDQRFLCQTTSIDFLIKQGFDFNKLFKEGISYLNLDEEDFCRKNFDEDQVKRQEKLTAQPTKDSNYLAIPEEHQEFIDDIIQKLQQFLDSEESELRLPKCNAFLRKLIYQTSETKFSDTISLETRAIEKDRILVASRIKSAEQQAEVEQQRFNNLIQEMEDYIGFSKVIRMIADSNKLVVGHNLLLDFLHTIDKFLTPLSDDYLMFKECANTLFAKVLDTKYMASLEPFKEFVQSTVLGQLLGSVSDKLPQYELEDGAQGYKLNEAKEHEAGYDSFITGLSFLAMWKYLGSLKNLPNSDIFGNSGIKLINPYLNKISLMYLTDNQFLNLAGQDLMPSREHVFHLTFPKEWKVSNILQLFSPFGNVQIAWLSESTAYVGLYKREQAALALKTLSKSDLYSITTFSRHQAQLNGQSGILPSPLKKKRKSFDAPPATKRRKNENFDGGSFSNSRRSCEPIQEEQGEEDEQESPRKTFDECDAWE